MGFFQAFEAEIGLDTSVITGGTMDIHQSKVFELIGWDQGDHSFAGLLLAPNVLV